MLSVTVKGLSVQFDLDGYESDDDLMRQSREALDVINVTLQREPFDLNAQIMSTELEDISQIETESICEDLFEDDL
jgi:hypothetical protein